MEENMEDSINNLPTVKRTVSKKNILFVGGSFLLLSGAVIASIFVLNRSHIIQTVQSSLANAATVMEKANGDNGYPQALPDELSDEKTVLMTGGGSFDGTTYCITGKSVQVASVVYHKTSSNEQPQSGACPKVVAVAKPGVVTDIETTIISAGQVGLTWGSAPDGVSYTLQCAKNEQFTDVVYSSMKVSQTRTCNNLESGVTYFARVRANNGSGEGSWSSVIRIATSQVSMPPTNLTVVAESSTSIRYSWSPINNARSYVLEWASDVNYQKDVNTLTLTGTSGVLSGLKSKTQYFFHVKAVTNSFDATQAAFSPQAYTTTP